MRIHRDRSSLSFRKRRRRGKGCLPFLMMIGVLVGVAGLSWDWLMSIANPPLTADLAEAEAAFARGDLDTAVALARIVVDNTPDDMNALSLLVRALIYRSYSDYNRSLDRVVAQQITASLRKKHPANYELMAIHALALQANGAAEEAAELALRVIEQDPNNVGARLALGLSYGGQGAFEAALRENRRAAEIASQYHTEWRMDSLRALAIAYSDLGQYDNAIQAIENAMAYNSRLVALKFERALYALQIGDTDGATVAYFQVLAFDPDNIKVRLRMCELSSLLRDRDAAVRYCTEVIKMAPAWSDGWYQLGREYFLQGNFPEALTSLNRCSTLQVLQNVPITERRFECWYLQGQAAEILGDCEGLLSTYNEFLEMAASADIPQTWTYPPEGPPICAPQPVTTPS